jgi:transcription termination factor Rho
MTNEKSNNQAHGVFKRLQTGSGFLRDPARSFQPGSDDVWVSPQLIREYKLEDGAEVLGTMQKTKKGVQLHTIEEICGENPAEFKNRVRFDRLMAVDPNDRLHLSDSGILSMRILELIAPIGKGTRGLIVSPPKAGKTRLLEEIAISIKVFDPKIRVIVLLIDERPEEVTHFRRSVDAEVLASSNDQSVEAHVNLAELTLAHARCELESSRDVVILLDSITRMSRAFNIHGTGSRRTMSGGLDARALEIPRRFFGLARNVEGGGSLTVIATALVDTGSRMDNFIFEEFKSTGNSEIVLDRALADARLFPAINIRSSGTRKEELLFSEDELAWVSKLRRQIGGLEPDVALKGVLKMMKMAKTNAELMEKVPL